MPFAPKRPCSNCGRINCSTHPRNWKKRETDRKRPSSHQRGYTRDWSAYSRARLRSNPLCAEHLKLGQYVQATVTDHIKPHRGDMALFWDEKNHQSLCKRCHDAKTASEDGGFGNSRRISNIG